MLNKELLILYHMLNNQKPKREKKGKKSGKDKIYLDLEQLPLPGDVAQW